MRSTVILATLLFAGCSYYGYALEESSERTASVTMGLSDWQAAQACVAQEFQTVFADQAQVSTLNRGGASEVVAAFPQGDVTSRIQPDGAATLLVGTELPDQLAATASGIFDRCTI